MEIKKINDIAWERYPDGCMSWDAIKDPLLMQVHSM